MGSFRLRGRVGSRRYPRSVLRRIADVQLVHDAHWLSGRGALWLLTGRKRVLVGAGVRARDLRSRAARQERVPIPYAAADAAGDCTYWQFRGRWYLDIDGLDADQVSAILVTRENRRHAAVARAKAQAVGAGRAGSRGRIADDVRDFVWWRDRGRCAHCGADSELQFDHVIPLALGGSDAAENLQILCGPCNRKKGVGVAVG